MKIDSQLVLNYDNMIIKNHVRCEVRFLVLLPSFRINILEIRMTCLVIK